jgi:hypothetical protein
MAILVCAVGSGSRARCTSGLSEDNDPEVLRARKRSVEGLLFFFAWAATIPSLSGDSVSGPAMSAETHVTVPKQEEPKRRIGGGNSSVVRLSFLLGAAVAAIAALAVALVAWLASRADSSPTTTRPFAAVIKPVNLSESGLRTLAGAADQPIYWAGPLDGFIYELRRKANGDVLLRYLPAGTAVGAPDGSYLTVATYPYADALAAMRRVEDGRGIATAGGGLALVDRSPSKSVHLAYPGVDYEAEVYDPSPERALELATSGQIQPVG